jgi:hypothetical protein
MSGDTANSPRARRSLAMCAAGATLISVGFAVFAGYLPGVAMYIAQYQEAQRLTGGFAP